MAGEINWSFWDVAVAVIIALVSAGWVLSQYYRDRKALIFDVISNFPIVNIDEKISSRIKVFFDDTQIKNVYMAIVMITNYGKPIPSQDFESPLTISVGSNAKVLTSNLVETIPNNLDVKLTIEDNKVLIAPLLLNEGDKVIVKLVGTDFGGINVTCRIIGVSEIKTGQKEYLESDRPLRVAYWICLVSFVLGSLVFLAGSFFEVDNKLTNPSIILAVAGLLGTILTLTFGLSRERRHRQRLNKYKSK